MDYVSLIKLNDYLRRAGETTGGGLPLLQRGPLPPLLLDLVTCNTSDTADLPPSPTASFPPSHTPLRLPEVGHVVVSSARLLQGSEAARVSVRTGRPNPFELGPSEPFSFFFLGGYEYRVSVN